MTEESLFLAALDRPDPDDRQQFLDGACAGDPDLRQRVDVLLAAFAAGKDKLEPPGGDDTATGPAPTADHEPGPEPGTVIAGRYKLLEKVGEGGMGEVWIARQTEPVQRKVAVKLIKPGMDSQRVIARFEAERQALALMDHPNIAKVLDGGLTDRGRPFFVMELVNGRPLTEFCDAAKLTPKDRLELFVPVCQAVQHAHQKGVVHRDLKPSNILVTLYDGRPVPKVIDFGVAKATGGKLTDESVATQFGAVVGTFEYMAPEQAGLSGLDVDTRADIYSLGVILYELLTGLRPFEGSRLRKAAIDELFRILREEDPPRPSTKLSTADALPSLAAVRGTDPKRLTALMRGELDWVVMRCLEKDRSRRYETANGLARDLQHYLADEPVDARPPSAGYKLRKFLRRNRGPVLAAGLVVLALAAGLAGTVAGLVRADAARARAVAAETGALDQARLAGEERDKAAAAAAAERVAKQGEAEERAKAEDSLEEARAISRHLTRMLGELKDSPRPAQSTEITIRELLDQAAKDVGTSYAGRPKLEAAIRHTIGENYEAIGALKPARDQYEAALRLRDQLLGRDHPDAVATAFRLARVWHGIGSAPDAERLYQRVAAARTAALGRAHPDTLLCLCHLGSLYSDQAAWGKATELFDEIRAACAGGLGQDHPVALTADLLRASMYCRLGKADQAMPLCARVLAVREATLGADHPDTLRVVHQLGLAYQRQNELARAEALFHRADDGLSRALGSSHIDAIACKVNLANVYERTGRFEQAGAQWKVVGDEYRRAQMTSSLFRSTVGRALALWATGKPDLAPPLLQEALTAEEDRLGPGHPALRGRLDEVAANYRAAGRPDAAVLLHEQLLKVREARRGAADPHTLDAAFSLASALQSLGRAAAAVPLLERVHDGRAKSLGADHADTRAALVSLDRAYRAAGKPALAVPRWEETLAAVEAKRGPDHPDTLTARASLAAAYRAAGRPADAEPLLRRALAGQRTALGPHHAATLATLKNLAAAVREQKRFDEADRLFRELWDACRESLPAAAPDRIDAEHHVGETLRQAGDLARAEPHLTNSYREAVQVKNFPRHWLRQYCDRLAALYTGWGKPAEAARWQVEAGKYGSAPQTANQLAASGLKYLGDRQFAAAEVVLRECLTLREKAEPEAWQTFNARSMLGRALLGQKKYAEAEPLLLTGYAGMREREAKIPPPGRVRLPEAAAGLIELYEMTGKPAEAEKWQAERARFLPPVEKGPPPREVG